MNHFTVYIIIKVVFFFAIFATFINAFSTKEEVLLLNPYQFLKSYLIVKLGNHAVVVYLLWRFLTKKILNKTPALIYKQPFKGSTEGQFNKCMIKQIKLREE